MIISVDTKQGGFAKTDQVLEKIGGKYLKSHEDDQKPVINIILNSGSLEILPLELRIGQGCLICAAI